MSCTPTIKWSSRHKCNSDMRFCLSVLQDSDHYTRRPNRLTSSLQLVFHVSSCALNMAEHGTMIVTTALSTLDKSAAHTHGAGLLMGPFTFPAHCTSPAAE